MHINTEIIIAQAEIFYKELYPYKEDDDVYILSSQYFIRNFKSVFLFLRINPENKRMYLIEIFLRIDTLYKQKIPLPTKLKYKLIY